MQIVVVHRGVYPERTGGTYTYVYELYRKLVARGHRVHVIARTREPVAPPPFELEGMRVHLYTIRSINPVFNSMQYLNNAYRLYDGIASQSDVDVLSVHDSHLGLKIARSRLGRKVCQLPTFHAPVFEEFRVNTAWRIRNEPSLAKRLWMRATEPPLEHWHKRYERLLLSLAQGIVVLSRYSRGHIEKNHPSIDSSLVKIIPSGVDTERFKPVAKRGGLRRALGLDEQALYVITVRNLTARKGLENLIDAMPRVLASEAAAGSDIRLLICGGGTLRESLESQVARLGLGEKVKLLGRVSNEDLPRYYQAADLFVLPTAQLEGFGIVTIEALSSNVPVVGTPAGATPEILTPIDVRLLTRDPSAEAIADGIIAWLDWRDEDTGTSRYRDEVLAKYTWEGVAAQMEDYYQEELEKFKRLT